MTFVHVKLKLETLPAGAILRIRLNDGEPLENIPRSLEDEGCTILNRQADGTAFLLTTQKPAA